jgi:HD-GYP domain-containing protein (c-di-GMP phosphodiesterase class II)
MKIFEDEIRIWHAGAVQRTGSELMAYVQSSLAAVDGYTDGHSHRVAEYCLHMASFLEDAAEMDYLAFALHDIGKAVLPAHLILKPDVLTAEEYAIVQLHPQLGADLVAPYPELRAALDVVAAHHERWDGNGYPARIGGTAIPLAARILAVADTFDAIVTDRPYRQARTAEEARFEIMRCAGTQFDPRVVEAFLQAFPALSAKLTVPTAGV